MRSTWIAALLLASAIAVPAYAQDQDHGGRDGGGQHQDGGGQRGGRGGGFRQGDTPGGGQPHVQPQQARPAGGDVGRQRPALTGDPNRVTISPDGSVHPVQRQPGGRDDHGRPVTNGGQATRDWNGQRRDGNGQFNGQPVGRPNWNGDRPDDSHNWNGGRPDNRSGAGRDWNGGRGDNDRNRDRTWNGNRFAGGGDWNRSWRQDRRYNWQGYRSQHRDIYRLGRYRPPYGATWGYRSYGIGFQIDPIFYGQDYWIGNPDYYRLPPAYGPYRWIRYYNDALLIDIEDGEVVDSIPNFFY